MHGDCNGVVIIPKAVAEEVVALCGEYVAAEEVVLEYLQGGEVSVEGLKAARAESKRRIGEFVARYK